MFVPFVRALTVPQLGRIVGFCRLTLSLISFKSARYRLFEKGSVFSITNVCGTLIGSGHFGSIVPREAFPFDHLPICCELSSYETWISICLSARNIADMSALRTLRLSHDHGSL
jgi:hypothetical protein